MKKIQPILLERLISVVLAGTMALMPIVFFAARLIDNDYTFRCSMQLSLLCVTGLCVIALIILCSVNETRRYKISFPDIIVAALFVTAVISCIFSRDNSKITINNSFVGGAKSAEGLLALTAYYLIFAAAGYITDYKRKLTVLGICMGAGAVSTFLGILQAAGVGGIFEKTGTAFGVHGEAYLFSSFCVLMFGIALGFLVYGKRPAVRIAALMLLGMFFAGTLLSYTTSGLLAIAVMLALGFVLEGIRAFINKGRFGGLMSVAAAIILCAGLSVICDGATGGKAFVVWRELGISTAITYKEGLQLPWLWNQLMDAFMRNSRFWFHGVGIDYLRAGSSGMFFTKAHNEFIQIMWTEGFIALGAYLVFCVTVLVKGVVAFFKNASGRAVNPASASLLIAAAGYLTQSFFNVSAVDIAPLFWIICGFICTRRFSDFGVKAPVTNEVSAKLDEIKSQIDEINEQA